MKSHPDERLTLRECFDRFYDKGDLSGLTLEKYHYALQRWERLTGDPAIADIDNDMIAKFRTDCIDEGLAPETINSNWAAIRAVLRLMAPQFYGNPRGRGVIENVPYMKPVPTVHKRPRRISLDDLNRAYLACEYATHPKIGCPPADWWRALLVLAYTSGLRKGDLLSLQRSQFDLEAGAFLFAAGKTQKEDVFPLHPLANLHLRLIWQPERDRLFRGMQGIGSRMYAIWHELIAKADLEPFTFHDIRRTAASEVERVRPGMGAVLLQHAPRSVTTRSYLNVDEELREAIHAMRIPETFEHGPRINGEIEARLRRVRHAAALEYLAPLPLGNCPDDWTFSKGSFSFRGQGYRLVGHRLLVLQALAAATGPLSVSCLGAVLYGPYVDDLEAWQNNVRSRISELRVFLKDAFALPDNWNPIVCVDRTDVGWVLNLPPKQTSGGAA